MLQGTKDWFEGVLDARLVKARAQATFAVGAAVGQVTQMVHQASTRLQGAVELLLHEAEDRANERLQVVCEALTRAEAERAALLDKVLSIETQLEVSLGKVLERQTRAVAVDKHDRKARVKAGLGAPITGLAAPARKGGDAPERVLGSVSTLEPRKPSVDEPLVSVRAYEADVARIVEAMRNGEIMGGVKRPGRAKPGGWCAPASSIEQWLAKHPRRVVDPVEA